MKKRSPYYKIWQELSRDKSMIFLAGPRQAGKTTLSQIISRSFSNHIYFNWDIPEDKARLFEDPTFFEAIERKDSSTPLVIFDEIHKYKDWKNYLKGVYDRFNGKYRFFVSGSGRLDIYQKGGDSLAGRYYLFHLWPFTIAELGNQNLGIEEFVGNPLQIGMEGKDALKKIWMRISTLSGFPEPYLSNRVNNYRRWSNTYGRQLIREDIRDMSGIKSISEMETLYFLLPSRVGSPLSIASFARDLKVSYNSIQSWILIFERFFLTFSISPWSKKIARAILKERKVYLWDVPRIKDLGARLENMVALELFRAVTAWNDAGYGRFSLHYIRNKEHQKVDFLIADDNKPLLLVEAKISEHKPSPGLIKFQNALGVPAVQLLSEGEGYRTMTNGSQSILIAPAWQWLARLP